MSDILWISGLVGLSTFPLVYAYVAARQTIKELEADLRIERSKNDALHRLLLDDLDDERKKHLDIHATGV